MRRMLAIAVLVAGIASASAQTVFAPPALDKAMLLVAHPAFRDNEYRQTVIVVGPAPNGGHVGAILNRPTKRSLHSLFPDDPATAAVRDNVFYGGPFSRGAMVALLKADSSPGSGALEIMPGVHFVFRAATIDQVVARTPNDARYYVGYVGWKPGELAENLKRGLWFPIAADIEDVFREGTDGFWEEVLLKALLVTDHPAAASAAVGLAEVFYKRGLYPLAEELVRRQVGPAERRLGTEHPLLGNLFYMLGAATFAQGNVAEAEQHFKRTLAIVDKDPKATPSDLQNVLRYLVAVCKRQDRASEAAPYEERLRALNAKGPDAK